MEIIQLTEENIDKYNLDEELNISKSELMNMIKSDLETDHFRFIYIQEIPWLPMVLSHKKHRPQDDD